MVSYWVRSPRTAATLLPRVTMTVLVRVPIRGLREAALIRLVTVTVFLRRVTTTLSYR